jgi:hypothetical protein
VARGQPVVSVPILELVEVCAREQARSTSLFEHLGGWVASTSQPALQRLFGAAAHRHAWHAELWARRSPTVPVAALAADVAAISEAGDDTDRWTAYVTALGLLIVDLEELRQRVDPDLDPSTIRVLDLVLADAHQLAHALTTTLP